MSRDRPPAHVIIICIALHNILLILHHVFAEILILLISHLYYTGRPYNLATIKHILSNILFPHLPYLSFSPIAFPWAIIRP